MTGPARDILSKPIDRDDIFLLLDSYKNNIELTSTLLEQQRQLLSQQSDLIKKQTDGCDDIKRILEKFSECAINTNNIQVKVIDQIKETKTAVIDKLSSSQTDNLQLRSEIVKQASKTSVSYYIIGVGLITIIISLIGFMVNWSAKFALIKAIAIKVGVSLT